MSTTTQPQNYMAELVVMFPDRDSCEYCADYEEFIVGVYNVTVTQLKLLIASRLGIETDEFIIDKPGHERVSSEQDLCIADAFFSPEEQDLQMAKGHR
ncbi:hypothetical protein GGI20_006256, partial [Coemansia sp. BCRC 34301]